MMKRRVASTSGPISGLAGPEAQPMQVDQDLLDMLKVLIEEVRAQVAQPSLQWGFRM